MDFMFIKVAKDIFVKHLSCRTPAELHYISKGGGGGAARRKDERGFKPACCQEHLKV